MRPKLTPQAGLAILVLTSLLVTAGTTPAGGATQPMDPDLIAEMAVPLNEYDAGPSSLGGAAPTWLTPELWQRLRAGEEIPIDEIPGFPYTSQQLQDAHDCTTACPPLPYTHIRPGAALGLTQFACTANFVFQNGDRLAIGTAGHCTHPGETHGTLLARPDGTIGFQTIGTTLRSTGAASMVGTDFALIEIEASNHPLVDSALSVLDGPCGWRAVDNPADPIQQYGHGLIWGAGGQSRHGISAGGSPNYVAFLAVPGVSWGDSGSPARFVDLLEAAAVTTHALPMTPYALGTSMPRVFQIIQEHWGMDGWQLVDSPNCP